MCNLNLANNSLWRVGSALLVGMMVLFCNALLAHDAVPKQVYLVVEKNRLIASNTRHSRFDELKLKPQEKLIEKAVGNAVIVAVTNERILGYGVSAGWRTLSILNEEKAKQVSVQDYATLVITNKRLLNFSGRTGRWAQQRHSVH